MDVFIYFIPITIVIALVMLMTLLWSIKQDQYQDLKQKGENLLFIDEKDKKL